MAKHAWRYYSDSHPGSKWISVGVRPAREMPACYAVYLDGSLSYIGQTTNLKKRFLNYGITTGYGDSFVTPWGSFSTVRVKVRYASKYGDWAMRELRLIRRLKPAFNCVGSTRKRAVSNV
jgi:hypothetical protein